VASLSSKRKASVNRRVQKRDARVDGAPKANHRSQSAAATRESAVSAFDESVYARLKNRFASALAGMGEADGDVRQVMRVLVQQEFDDGGRDAALKMQPYIVKYVREYRDQRPAPSAAQ
jgi:hypothetical protein